MASNSESSLKSMMRKRPNNQEKVEKKHILILKSRVLSFHYQISIELCQKWSFLRLHTNNYSIRSNKISLTLTPIQFPRILYDLLNSCYDKTIHSTIEIFFFVLYTLPIKFNLKYVYTIYKK